MVEVLNEFEIALDGERGIGAGRVEGREKNAEAHAVAHETLLLKLVVMTRTRGVRVWLNDPRARALDDSLP
jgi:hypothetical protein